MSASGALSSRHGAAAGAALRAFDEILRTIAFAGEESVIASIVPHLRDLLEADQAIAYRIAHHGASMGLDFGEAAGLGPKPWFRRLAEDYLGRSRGQVTTYRLPVPTPDERNSVYLLETPEARDRHFATPIVRELFPSLGIYRQDQIRTLICDGPHILAWIGAFRLDPFGPAEAERLEALVEPLHKRLKLEESLRRLAAQGAALDVAMDVLGAPAFILDRGGGVVHANEAGRALGRDERDALLQRGRGVLEGRLPEDPSLRLLHIQAEGLPPHSLLVQLPERSTEQRLAAFAKHWRLTRRQVEVLRYLIAGKPNKAIAACLEIQEGTVELHVTSLHRKVDVESRSELIAAFWSQTS